MKNLFKPTVCCLLTAAVFAFMGCENNGEKDNNSLPLFLLGGGGSSWYTFLGGYRSDEARSVAQTDDRGYIVAGFTFENIPSLGGTTPVNAYASNGDMLVVKLDSGSAVGWYTFLGGSGHEEARSVAQTSDGGYIVAGHANADIATMGGKAPVNPYSSDNDMLVVKLDSSGAVAWYTFLGGSGSNYAYSVAQTGDGGYIVAGFASENIPSLGSKTPVNAYSSNYDMLVVKLDSSGAIAWYTFLGGIGYDYAHSITQTDDGEYIVAGYATEDIPSMGGRTPVNSFSSYAEMLVVKLASSGAVTWYTFLGGSGSDYASSIEQTADGGYIVAGYATEDIPSMGGRTPVNVFSTDYDMLVVKLDSSGAVAWYTFLGGSGYDFAYSITQTDDGGYIVAGYANADIATMGGRKPVNTYSSESDMLVAKLDPDGAVGWYTFIGGSSSDSAYSVAQTSDGGCIVAGFSMGDIATRGGKKPVNAYDFMTDMFVAKLKSNGSL